MDRPSVGQQQLRACGEIQGNAGEVFNRIDLVLAEDRAVLPGIDAAGDRGAIVQPCAERGSDPRGAADIDIEDRALVGDRQEGSGLPALVVFAV